MKSAILFIAWMVASCMFVLAPLAWAGKQPDEQIRAQYLQEIRSTFKHHWFPPQDAVAVPIAVAAKIASDGHIFGCKIVKSCGNKLADSAARFAVASSSPVRPVPVSLLCKKTSLPVLVSFDWRKSQGGILVEVQQP